MICPNCGSEDTQETEAFFGCWNCGHVEYKNLPLAYLELVFDLIFDHGIEKWDQLKRESIQDSENSRLGIGVYSPKISNN